MFLHVSDLFIDVEGNDSVLDNVTLTFLYDSIGETSTSEQVSFTCFKGEVKQIQSPSLSARFPQVMVMKSKHVW